MSQQSSIFSILCRDGLKDLGFPFHYMMLWLGLVIQGTFQSPSCASDLLTVSHQWQENGVMCVTVGQNSQEGATAKCGEL